MGQKELQGLGSDRRDGARFQSGSRPNMTAVDAGSEAHPSDTTEPDLERSETLNVGEGIRRERVRRNMTLSQLASTVGLTSSAISQIERGIIDPSLSTLRRIAETFDLPMFQLLIGAPARNIVVRRNERPKIAFAERDLEYELVTADTSGEFEILSLVVAPGFSTSEKATGHISEECSVLLRGRLRVEIAGQFFSLEPGDSIKIHREVPHRFENDGDTAAEVLMVLSPPRFF